MRLLIISCLFGVVACGAKEGRHSYPWGRDVPREVDAAEADTGPVGPSPVCTIQKPQPNRILTGSAEVKVVVDDPGGAAITRVVFAFLIAGQAPVKVGEVGSVPPDGNIEMTIDSRKVPDGKKMFFCQVETQDGRKGSAQVPVHVDNNPPKVELYPPSTPPYSNFFSDLVIRISVSDGEGVGTGRVVIKVNGDAVADISRPAAGLQDPVTVPTHELHNGKNTVEITASDLVGNTTPSPLSYWVNFVPPPAFETAEEWSLPSGITVDRIRRIDLAKGQGILGYGSKGAYIFGKGTDKNFALIATLTKASVSLAKVADVNGDGLQDVVLVIAETGERYSIQFFPQISGSFSGSPSWNGSVSGKVNDLAFGDLNRDGKPDIAAALEKSIESLAISLSNASGAWSGFTYYGGVDRPSFVVVADFTDDGTPDILLARRSSGIVTLFPVSGTTGTPLVGTNSVLQEQSATGQGKPLNAITSILLLYDETAGNALLVTDRDLNSLFYVTRDPETPGTFVVSRSFPTCVGPIATLLEDVDQDGLDDVAIFCQGSTMVHLFFGLEGGGYEAGAGYLSGSQALDFVLVPVKGSRLDLVVLDKTGQMLRVLPGDDERPRHFLGPTMVSLGFRPKAITIGRYLRPEQGIPKHKDIAVLDSEEGGKGANIHFFASSLDTGRPTVKAGYVESKMKGATDLLSADFDKNGYDDLLVPSQTVSSTTKPEPTMGRVLLQEGVSHLAVGVKSIVDPVTGLDQRLGMWAGDSPTLAVVGDFKREVAKPGVLDLAVIAKFKSSGQALTLFQPFVGQGDGNFLMQEGVLYPVDVSLGPSSMATARLTGGSNYDVVLTFATTGEFTIFYNKGLGLFAAGEGETERFALGSDARQVVIESLDAPVGSADDPYPDLIFLTASDVAIVKALAKVGNEVQYAPPAFLGHQGAGPVDIAVRDINRDGFADILVLDEHDNMVTVYLNLAQGRFSKPYRYQVGQLPESLAVDDLDADGCPDIVTADTNGKTVTILRNLACLGL